MSEAPSLIERETIICFNEKEKTIDIETFNTKWIRKLDNDPRAKLINQYEYTSSSGEKVFCKRYELPSKSWLQLRPAKEYSEQEREILRNRFEKNIKTKNNLKLLKRA